METNNSSVTKTHLGILWGGCKYIVHMMLVLVVWDELNMLGGKVRMVITCTRSWN
jgi:hypothetical protein